MFVRVFDKENNRYYKSIVYCAINEGYYRQYIVVNPYTSSFELVEYLDKSTKPLLPLVEIIQDDRDDWITYENSLHLKYQKYCKQNKIKSYPDLLWGYKEVCENFEFLANILETRVIPCDNTYIPLRKLSDEEEWNYILTQADADNFMELFFGFHDATLNTFTYEEKSRTTRIVSRFNNEGWYGIVEICYEGIIALNLRPPTENYSREISRATLVVHNETVFWADGYMEKEDLSYTGTYIKSLCMKWRKIG